MDSKELKATKAECNKVKQKFDFSIHFTLKGQTIDEVNELFDWWLKKQAEDKDSKTGEVLFGSVDFKEIGRTNIHHCFMNPTILNQKRIPLTVYDFIGEISRHTVCWNDPSKPLTENRRAMLVNLKRLDGVAIFIGKIEDGVLEELQIAQSLNIQIIEIGELITSSNHPLK